MIKTIKVILVLMFSLFSSEFNKKKSKKAPMSIYDISINNIEGNEISLSDYKGKYILFRAMKVINITEDKQWRAN